LKLAKLYQRKNDKEKLKNILEKCVGIDKWKDNCQQLLNFLN